MLLLARIGPRVHPPTALDGWGSAAISLRGRREATQLRGPPPLNLLAQAARQRTWLLPHVRSAPGVFASRVAEVLTPSIPGHPGFRAEGGVMGRRLGVAGVGCGGGYGEGAEAPSLCCRLGLFKNADPGKCETRPATCAGGSYKFALHRVLPDSVTNNTTRLAPGAGFESRSPRLARALGVFASATPGRTQQNPRPRGFGVPCIFGFPPLTTVCPAPHM